MDDNIKKAIESAVKRETLAKLFKLELIELDTGHSVVEMMYRPDFMGNIYDRAHGGAIYALIDEAFVRFLMGMTPTWASGA